MASHVAIIDDSLSGRMLIGSLLAAGHYEVSSSDSSDVREGASQAEPSLVLIGPSVETPDVVLQRLKARPEFRYVPFLILTREMTSARRLDMMAAGARDVLDYPLNELYLLARVRSLLRESDSYRELERRRLAALRFGFAEAPSAFASRKRLTIVRDRGATRPLPSCGEATSWTLEAVEPASALSPPDNSVPCDGYVLDWRATKSGSAVRQVLPELRARPHSRHSVILVIHDAEDPEAAVHALDAGATDVITDAAHEAEFAYRIARMLKRKVADDALRLSTENSLQLAMTDQLTGLYNRRYAEAYLADLLSDVTENKSFAVMLADIDHFKAINDTYGHAAGDEVLCEIASRLREEVRSIDLVARYGGEEFLLVLAESSLAQAKMAADRLSARIHSTPVILGSGAQVDVTVSIGVSMGDDQVLSRMNGTFGETAGAASRKTMSDLLQRADKALYRAKALGRNRVQLAVNPV